MGRNFRLIADVDRQTQKRFLGIFNGCAFEYVFEIPIVN